MKKLLVLLALTMIALAPFKSANASMLWGCWNDANQSWLCELLWLDMDDDGSVEDDIFGD